jgi:hypothetical protein
VNIGVSAWWWYSSQAGSSATTTVNFASNQHSNTTQIWSVTNIFAGTSAVSPWTSSATPIVQSATAADSTAPASTASSKTVDLAALQPAYVFYYCARGGSATTTTAPTGYTEVSDQSINDATGSVASTTSESSAVTAPPASSTTAGPATFATSTTGNRASIAWEMVPDTWVNCMVSGIEVR